MSVLTPQPDLLPQMEVSRTASEIPPPEPDSEEETVSTDMSVSMPYAPPVWKFVLFSVVTFGVYEFYWLYRLWVFVKTDRQAKVNAFARTFFWALFAGSLIGYLEKFLKERTPDLQLYPAVAGVAYFVTNGLYRLPDPYWLISMLTFVPLLPTAYALRKRAEAEGYGPRDSGFRWWQGVLVTIGGLFFALWIWWTFSPDDTETDVPTAEYGSGILERPVDTTRDFGGGKGGVAPKADPYDADYTG